MNCDKCPLKKSYSLPLKQEKKPRNFNGLLFIGSGIGKEEIRNQEHLSGLGNIILSMVLNRSKLKRKESIITNACLCYPGKSRVLTFEELINCRKELINYIKKIKPKVIITLGTPAASSLLFEEEVTITSLRGPGKWSNKFNCWILFTYNPKALLHNSSYYIDFAHDLMRAKELLSLNENDAPNLETKYKVYHTVIETKKLIAKLSKKKLISVDIETTGFNWKTDKIILISFTWKEGYSEQIVKMNIYNVGVLKELKKLFENKKIKFLWQNGQFDIKFFKFQFRINIRVDEDSLLKHYCLDERRKTHSLTRLCQIYLGAKNYEKEFKKSIPKGGTYDDAPKEMLYKYAAHDTDYVFKLSVIFSEKMKNEGRVNDVYRELLIAGTNMLSEVEMRGFEVDKDNLKALNKKYLRKINIIKRDINAIIKKIKWTPEKYFKETKAKSKPQFFNFNSSKQVAHVLYDMFKLPKHLGERKTDRPALDFLFYDILKISENVKEKKKDCVRIVHEGYQGEVELFIPKKRLESVINRFVNNLILYRRLTKVYNTYIEPLEKHADEENRVHSQFMLFNTVNGRLASENPNLQNQPRAPEIRNIFRAKEGYVLLKADYSQIELMMLANISQDPVLLNIYKTGEDVHDKTASRIYGPNYTSVQRTMGKTVTFGIPYGRGEKSIARQFQIPLLEARKMIKGWHNSYPVASNWMKEEKKRVRGGEIIESLWGRRRRFGLVTKKNQNHIEGEIVNFHMAPDASDCLLKSAINLRSKLKKYSSHIVNLVHDEMEIEVPIKYEEEVAKLMQFEMEKVPKMIGIKIPFKADVSVGTHWGSLIKRRK